jgi:hypothetical protein
VRERGVIVLVETNFVLELVFSRDKFACCRSLLELAKQEVIELALPAYSMVEPYEAIIRRQKSRGQAHDRLTRELREITRSAHFAGPAAELAQFISLLIQVGETEQHELRNVLSELLNTVTLTELNAEILHLALEAQDVLGMSPQDSVVYASVLSTLRKRGGPACFITRNSKDFADPRIDDELAVHGCKLLFDFENGLNYVRGKLTAP